MKKWISLFVLLWITLPNLTIIGNTKTESELNNLGVGMSIGYDTTTVFSDSGSALIFGRNIYGNIGTGNKEKLENMFDLTSVISLANGEYVVSVSPGTDHTLLVTSLGKVYGFGANWYGQLGNSTDQTPVSTPDFTSAGMVLEPVEITTNFADLGSDKIIKVETGQSFSIAISEQGKVYTWGYNGDNEFNGGKLGTGDYNSYRSPQNVTSNFNLDTGETIVDIHAGESTSAFISSEGRLFIAGPSGGYVFYSLDNKYNSNLPLDVTSDLNLETGDKVVQVELQAYQIMVLTEFGHVYSAGMAGLASGFETNQSEFYNISNQLSDELYTNEKVVDIALGMQVSGLLTNEGRLFIFGFNDNGQLGLGSAYPTATVQLPFLYESNIWQSTPEEEIIQIDAGRAHMGMITSSGRVLVWGPNQYGEVDPTLVNQVNPNLYDVVYEPHLVYAAPQNATLKVIGFDDEVMLSVSRLPGSNLSDVLLPTAPSVTGYTFINYSENIPATMPEDGITIYANYMVNEYVITFDSNGGTSIEGIAADYDAAITAPSEPQRTGYTFAGWYTDDALTQPFTFETMPAEDITLNAKWIIKNHTITIQNMSEYFTQIFPTYYNFYGITSSNQIFAVGHSLGLGLGQNSGYTYEFTNITSAFDLEDGEYITRIETGDGFTSPVTYFMTSLNRIFVLGTNTDSGNLPQGTLGVEDDTIQQLLTPTNITPNFDLANGEFIIDLHGMRYAGIAVSNLGNVYSWGYNEYGNILRDARYVRYHDIADVTSKFTLNTGDKIIGVEGSIYSVIFITEQGKIYGAGWHAYNAALGQGNTNVQAYTTPVEIVLPLEDGENILDAQLSLSSGLVLTTTGRLIQWSDLLTRNGGTLPAVIDILNSNESVVSIHSGQNTAFIITDTRVLASGSNTYGSLGNGSTISTSTWTDVTSNFQLDGALPLSILTANQVTYTLSKNKTVYVNGYNWQFSDYATGAVLTPSPVSMPEFEVTSFDFNYNADLTDFVLDDQGSLFFRGFFNDAEFTQPFDLTNMPDNDFVLYAKFSALLEYDMSSVSWVYDLGYIYDGTEFKVEIDESTLPEGVSVATYTLNKATNAGTYTATVTFNYDDTLYFEPTFESLTWTIEKANYDFSNVQWADGLYAYDGNPVSMTLLNLPEGVTPVYTNGSATNAGTYTTSVTFQYDSDNYYEPSFNDATWIIEKANYDFSNVRWSDGVYTYDGIQVNMTLLNLPAGVTPIYTNGSATNAGTYTTSVTFEYDEDNYNQPDFNEATWIIQKGNYDFTNTTWSSSNLTYNGLSQSVVLNNIPSGLTPTYTNNTFTNVGTYTATVTFAYDTANYNEPTFTDNIWQIEKANYDYSSVTWDTSLFTYNGSEQTIIILNLPHGVTAIYVNNTQTNAGTYTVSATFTYDSANYNEPEIASFDWVIEKNNYDFSTVSWDSSVLTYTGYEQTVSVIGLPLGVTPNYINNTAINAGTYTASVTFNFDTTNYHEPIFTDNIFVIEKAYYDLSTVSWNTSTVVYNGFLQTVEVIGLSQGITPIYTNHTAINAGTYTANVTFNFDSANYHEPTFSDNIWTILKGSYDFTNVRWDYTEAIRETYNQIELTVLNLPAGLTPVYTNNVQTDPGVYIASVAFLYDEANYNEPTLDSLTWEILKLYYITYQIDGIENKQAYVAGESTMLPESPVKEGFTFLRWMDMLPTNMDSKDLVIHAQFVVNQYTIHFINQDGSVVESWTTDFGSTLDTNYVPQQPGFVFSGFSQTIPVSMPSKDLMVEVYWTNIKDTQDDNALVSIDNVDSVIDPNLIENKEVRVTVSIDLKDDSILDDTERHVLRDYLSKNQASVILDVSVLIKEDDNTSEVVKEFTKTTTLTISVPYELRNQKGLHLVRLVNGTIEAVEFTLDEENQTMTFETASLTGLTLVYETPNTNDWLWWGVVILPVGIAIYGILRIFFILLKKEDENEEKSNKLKKQ